MSGSDCKDKLEKLVNEITENTGVKNQIDSYCMDIDYTCKTYFNAFLSDGEPLVGSLTVCESGDYVFILQNCSGERVSTIKSDREELFIPKVTTELKYRLSIGVE